MTLKTILWDAPAEALGKFLEIKGFFLAQAIAFKSLITVIPVTLFALGILGEYFQSQENLELVAGLIRELIPTYLDDFVAFFEHFQNISSNVTLIGGFGTLILSTILMNTLCIVISEVFAGTHHIPRPFFRQYAFSFRMTLQVGVVFLLTLLATIAIQTLNSAGLSFIQKLGIDRVWVQSGWRQLINLAGILIPFLLTAVMFFQLYYLIPKPRPPFKSALLGTATAAIFWEGAKSLFTLYATHFAFFNRFRGTAALDPEGFNNTIGLIIAFMVWVYYSGIVLIIGSIVTMLDAKRREAKAQSESEQNRDPGINEINA